MGDILRRFNIEGECKKQGIRDAIIWGTGFVCLTQKYQLYALLDFDQRTNSSDYAPIVKLKNTVLARAPNSWTIIEPDLSSEKSLEVIISNEDSLLFVTETSRQDMQISNGPFDNLAISPDGKVLAAYTNKEGQGQVWIITVDFSNELVKFNTRSPSPPHQLVFCGTRAVVCYWRMQNSNVILLIDGPNGSYFHLKKEGPLRLIQEIDGVRILSHQGYEILSRISNSSIILKDPESPASLLYSASEHFYKYKSSRADEIVRKIQLNLPNAVTTLIEAALAELDPDKQQELLTAASFGISFIDFYAAKTFVPAVRTLRVLNALRDKAVGIPITHTQYLVLSATLIIDRLLARDLHMLAFEICSYLQLKVDKVLIHWARRKVSSKMSDAEVANSIVSRLNKCPGVSFASIAYEAVKADRFDLATKLLDYEPKAADQVPLLIHMAKYENALTKAIQSGDPDLIHLALLVFKRQGNLVDFYNMLRRQKGARSYWENVLKETDPLELQNLYSSEGQLLKIAALELDKAYSTSDLDNRFKIQQGIMNMLKKRDPFTAKQTEDEMKLLLIQRDLEMSLGGSFVGSSLSSTLYRCILMGYGKRAKKIRMDFKVPNKRWWWIKIRALADSGRWAALRAFSTAQPSPVGYGPFAEACIRHTNSVEATHYVGLMPNNDAKVMLYVQLQRWEEALATLEKLQNPEDVVFKVRNKCKDPTILARIDDLITKYENEFA